jgi:hypothetical protein
MFLYATRNTFENLKDPSFKSQQIRKKMWLIRIYEAPTPIASQSSGRGNRPAEIVSVVGIQ